MASNIVFDGTKGISLPSFTTTEKNAIVSPATGAIVYDSTLKQESLYNGSAWVNVNASGNSAITSGTVVASTSGTSIDFTSIPSWVKRITVMFQGVSTSGTSNLQVQLGTGSTTYTTSGYVSRFALLVSNISFGGSNTTTGYGLITPSAGGSYSGNVTITNITGNGWVENHVLVDGISTTSGFGGGSITLGSALTAVRITTVNGTDTFDAGSINILYE